ncbi:MAG: MFS transporter [bacterium]
MLGFVSLLMDTSSELIHSLLPVFMATVLGASMVTIGIVEGVAEGAAAVAKVFSGAISDYLGRRKLLAVAGYGLSAATKPVFPLATSIGWVFGARFFDRIGKGIRGAPRDALVADITPEHLRGAAYGLRQALDSVGAFIGPSLALVFMIWFMDNIDAVMWVGVFPAILAVLLLVVGVREPKRSVDIPGPTRRLTMAAVKRLPNRYWFVVGLGAAFTLARFSEAFLILRAQDVGLAIGYVPAVMIVMNVVYAAFAYPAGAAVDRFPARMLLVFGVVVLIGADIVLAVAASPWVVFIGAAFWGLHMAFTQGLLAKLVADTAPGHLRGTGFGIFNLVSGVAVLLASVIAGSLWSAFGAPAAFVTGASFAALSGIGLLLYRPGGRSATRHGTM